MLNKSVMHVLKSEMIYQSKILVMLKLNKKLVKLSKSQILVVILINQLANKDSTKEQNTYNNLKN